jgi:hypothetical protein
MPAMSASWDHFFPLSVLRMKPLGSMAVQTDAEGHDRELMSPSDRPVGTVSGSQLTPPLVVRITSGAACLVPEAWHTVADLQTTEARYCASLSGSTLVLHVRPPFVVRRVIG